MTVRTDITFRPDLSPRLIIVDAPSTELILQDLHDTVCAWQDGPPNHDYDVMIASAGKEALGGGVTVGITTTLQNAQVHFEARNTAVNSGTITTLDTTGTIVIDTGGTFLTDANRGDLMVNVTDGSHATITEVISDTELRVTSIGGPGDNEYQVSDVYEIFAVETCSISGGNLVAVDDVGDPIEATLPSFGTQIVRTSSSSATLQELADIQFSSFNGAVEVDLINGVSGTEYPIGTPRSRSGNLTDALSIANTRGFTRLRIIGDATIDSGLDYTGFTIEGESQTKSVLTIDTAANVTNAEFVTATVTGVLDGGATLLDCRVQDMTYVDGFVESCLIDGTLTLSGTAPAHVLDCWSGVTKPTIDLGGSGSSLTLRNYSGGVRLTNKSGLDVTSLDMLSGDVTIDSTCTAGTIIVRGVAKLTNNGTSIVDDTNLLSGGDLIAVTSKVQDIHKRLGLDPDDPFTHDYKNRVFKTASGDIRITVEGDGADLSSEVRD